MKRVTQEEIATRLGVDRTTVSKVLGHNPDVYVGNGLRHKIFNMAERLGYIPRTRRPATERVRIVLGIPAEVQFRVLDGTVRAKGTARIDSLGPRGATLSDFRMTPPEIRIEPGYAVLRFRLDSTTLELKGDFNRLDFVQFVRISIKFLGVTAQQKSLLRAQWVSFRTRVASRTIDEGFPEE